jgi:hypothetical protein
MKEVIPGSDRENLIWKVYVQGFDPESASSLERLKLIDLGPLVGTGQLKGLDKSSSHCFPGFLFVPVTRVIIPARLVFVLVNEKFVGASTPDATQMRRSKL